MPAQHKDLRIEQGTTWSQGWMVTYNGSLIDATWTAKSEVRETPQHFDKLHTFNAEVTAEGVVIISATPADSTAWDWTEGVYDVEVSNADQSVTLRVAQGEVSVSLEVTR